MIVGLLQGSFGTFVMVGFGILASLTVVVWWPMTAFLESWWWGGLTLLFPPTFFVFACRHFQKARKPLICGLFFLTVSVLLFIIRTFLSTFFEQVP